jgi:D,D-heptose 1,7-bisphosphate phosphatase
MLTQEELIQDMRNSAVFLDRDGTIAKDVNYCRRIQDFEILPDVPEAIRLLNKCGYKVVVITNQSGIARGYFTEQTLVQIHEKMKNVLASHGARIDAIYYCPHHPNEGCECRKPQTALFLRAATDLNIDVHSSFMIGDMQTDIEAGRAIQCKTILVTTNHEVPWTAVELADYVTSSLLDATLWVIKSSTTRR